MSIVTTFDSLEDMIEALEEQGKKAKESANNLRSYLEKFRELGTCFVMAHPAGFFIYGQVEGSDYPEDLQDLEASFQDGYVFCRAFSEVCPEGELGSIHISKIEAVISQEGFNGAREKGWPSTLTPELQRSILVHNPDQGFH